MVTGGVYALQRLLTRGGMGAFFPSEVIALPALGRSPAGESVVDSMPSSAFSPSEAIVLPSSVRPPAGELVGELMPSSVWDPAQEISLQNNRMDEQLSLFDLPEEPTQKQQNLEMKRHQFI